MFRDITNWVFITIYLVRLLLWLRTLKSFYSWLDNLECVDRIMKTKVPRRLVECVLLGWYGVSYIFLWDIVPIVWLADKIGYSPATTVGGNK